MGIWNCFAKVLALAGLVLLLGTVHVARADTLAPTISCTSSTVACFENVLVTGIDNGYPISSTNPLTSTDSVSFLVTDGTEQSVSILCTSGCVDGGNTASLFGGQVFTGTTAAPVVSASSFVFNSADDSVCEGGACNTKADPLDNLYITLTSPDSFKIESASLTMTFTLPSNLPPNPPVSTPEPSSLLMLGAGLLALVGFGLRRKGIV